MSYQDIYQQSIEQPEVFWRKQAKLIKWYEFPEKILSQDENGFYRWFVGGKLNTSYLALDAQIEDGRGDNLALIYDSPVTNSQRKFTYTELRDEVSVPPTIDDPVILDEIRDVMRERGIGQYAVS